MKQRALANPGVPFPPPTLFVIGVGCAWLLNRMVPLPISALIAPPIRVVTGWAMIAAGLGVVGWALVTFVRARTGIYPTQPARTIVAYGPYRYSRNPMYVGLTAITAGIGFWIDNAWILVMIPLALMALTRLVIRREEAYLADAFGESYTEYQSRVRRWL